MREILLSRIFCRKIRQHETETFSEEQIAFSLRQHESGTAVAEIVRKMGITKQTLLQLEKEIHRTGLGVAEDRRLKQLEEEDRMFIKLVADLILDKRPQLYQAAQFTWLHSPGTGSEAVLLACFRSAPTGEQNSHENNRVISLKIGKFYKLKMA